MPSSIKIPRGLRIKHGDASFYLGDTYFLLTIAVALALHLAAIFIWEMVPRERVVDIPVRVLNVKLGDDADEVSLQPAQDNNADVEKLLSQTVRIPEASKVPETSVDKASDPTAVDTSMRAPKQFVRQNSVAAIKPSALGNSAASNAEMLSRYSQLISAWIQKFKIYPEEAQAQGMKGETVVRVRIDRHGNIRYYALERSTGYELLDKAAIDMVRRANPVPALPDDVSSDDLQEFLIPVIFK